MSTFQTMMPPVFPIESYSWDRYTPLKIDPPSSSLNLSDFHKFMTDVILTPYNHPYVRNIGQEDLVIESEGIQRPGIW
jgi:hypothetical protein